MHCTASVISAFMTTHSDGIEPLTAADFNLLWVEVQLRESFLLVPSFCVCVGESSGTTPASVALGRVLVSSRVERGDARSRRQRRIASLDVDARASILSHLSSNAID